MALNYGTIETTFWNNPHARGLSIEAKMLYAYLRSSPHGKGLFAYSLPMIYIQNDTRMSAEQIMRAIKELSIKPWALWDQRTEMVFLPGVVGSIGNKVPNPNVARFLANGLLALPDCNLKALAIAEIMATGAFTTIMQSVLGSWRLEDGQGSLGLAPAQPSLLPDTPDAPRPPVEVPKPPKQKREAARLPEDWCAPQEYRQYALERGFTEPMVDAVEVRFRRYWTSPDAKNPAKKDWLATWQNWIDREAEKNNGHSTRSFTGATTVAVETPDQWADRERMFKEKGRWLPNWGPTPDEPGYRGKRKAASVPPPPV